MVRVRAGVRVRVRIRIRIRVEVRARVSFRAGARVRARVRVRARARVRARVRVSVEVLRPELAQLRREVSPVHGFGLEEPAHVQQGAREVHAAGECRRVRLS